MVYISVLKWFQLEPVKTGRQILKNNHLQVKYLTQSSCIGYRAPYAGNISSLHSHAYALEQVAGGSLFTSVVSYPLAYLFNKLEARGAPCPQCFHGHRDNQVGCA